MAMVGLLVLMACANVGSLLLVRAAGRVREMSVRYALGAKRSRVTRQLLVEGLLLALAGGFLGILLAPQASALLIHNAWGSAGNDLPFSSSIDVRILAFNFLLAIAVSLLFSLAPALQFWRPDVSQALKQQLTTASGSLRFRRLTVGLQIGLSLLLLLGAGLFVRTLHNLKSVDVGFATDHLVTFTLDPALAGYQPNQNEDVETQVLQSLAALPGIRSVAGTTDQELANDNTGHDITIAGYTAKEDENMNVEAEKVSPGYFSAMGMTLLAGRELSEQDREGLHKVAIVNESFARHFFGDARLALGHYFGNGGGDVKTDIEIVGVVKDAKHTGVREDVLRTVFTPYLQDRGSRWIAFYIRTVQPPETAQGTIRQAMQTLDSKLVLDNFRTMEAQIDDNLTTERIVAMLASSFGLLAVFMAVIGLYGVLAYSTAQRSREIGIRIALGAPRASVMRLVLMETLRLAGISIAVALPVSLLLARGIRSQLFGISSNDPLTIALVTLLVAAVAIAAALIPARRAAKVDPMVALRYE
jgi:predicted permease